jgi:hypothetical protein
VSSPDESQQTQEKALTAGIAKLSAEKKKKRFRME